MTIWQTCLEDSRDVESILNMGRETINMNRGIWNTLPEVVLIEIFKYLPERDRVRASLVNKQWHKIFESPCLWRLRHFDMGGVRALKNGYKACKYAEQFGQHLRRLFITCSHPSYHTCKLFQKSIGEFFDKLKEHGTQLTEFELCRLELERYWKYETPKEKLVTIFCKFLRTQEKIICLDFSSAQFDAQGGVKVLDAIATKSGHVVQDMLIEDFFHPYLSIFKSPKFFKALKKFSNLKYLAMNYNCISEETVEILAKSLKNKLEYLNIKIVRNDPHFHRVSGYTWTIFSRACPKLRVAFWFESIGSYTDIIPILVNEAPTKDVHIWTGYDEDRDWRLAHTISHIASCYSSTLEYLALELDNTQEVIDDEIIQLAKQSKKQTEINLNAIVSMYFVGIIAKPQYLSLELDNTQEVIDDEIIQLVKQSKKLTEINLNAIVSIATVEQLCELQREGKINLALLHVTFCGVNGLLQEEFDHVRKHYTELFRETSLDFKLYRFDY